MLVDYIRTLYAYSTWANERVFEAAGALTPEQFVAPGAASLDSVRATLVHLVSAQRTWLARARRVTPPAELQAAAFLDCRPLHQRWQEIEQQTQALLVTLDTAALGGIVHYVNAEGQPNAYPLWQILFHQAIHAAQHRSEAAMLLTQLGASPGWLDFLYYLDLTGQTPAAERKHNT
ncbi:MAG TPA: DinB family protein [Ktedonobacterales bacterium]